MNKMILSMIIITTHPRMYHTLLRRDKERSGRPSLERRLSTITANLVTAVSLLNIMKT